MQAELDGSAGLGRSDDDFPHAVELIRRAGSVLLVGHINPDADALGSALALGLALERRGVAVAVAFGAPDLVPESLRTLPGQHLVRPVREVPTHIDLLITMDVASAERLGGLEPLLDTVPSLVVDHHTSNTGFGTHHLIDPSAEATVVLVRRILRALDAPVDADIAANLYAGLATDTGIFRNVTGATHELAAELADVLIEAGIRPAQLMRPIVDTHPFGWLTMLAAVLGRAQLDAAAVNGKGLVHTAVTLDDAAGLRQEELDSVIDILRTVREADVAAVVKQLGPQLWQVSLRGTPGGIDVSQAAAALGGGGHVLAAGYTWHGHYATAVTALTEVLARSGV